MCSWRRGCWKIRDMYRKCRFSFLRDKLCSLDLELGSAESLSVKSDSMNLVLREVSLRIMGKKTAWKQPMMGLWT